MQLTKLDLTDNRVTGTLPQSWSTLTQASTDFDALYLQYNSCQANCHHAVHRKHIARTVAITTPDIMAQLEIFSMFMTWVMRAMTVKRPILRLYVSWLDSAECQQTQCHR